MKKLSILFLIILLAAALIAGCARVPAAGSQANAPTKAPAIPAEEPAAEGEATPAEEPAAEGEAAPAEESAPAEPVVSETMFELSYSSTYTAPIQNTEYTAGDGYIFGIITINEPAGYGLSTKDDAELRFSDGTALSTTISSMSTQADGTIDYFTLVFAVPKESQDMAESLYIDGQLFQIGIL